MSLSKEISFLVGSWYGLFSNFNGAIRIFDVIIFNNQVQTQLLTVMLINIYYMKMALNWITLWQAGEWIFLITEDTDILMKQPRRKPQETLELKKKPLETSYFPTPLVLEGEWMLESTSVEVSNPFVFPKKIKEGRINKKGKIDSKFWFEDDM